MPRRRRSLAWSWRVPSSSTATLAGVPSSCPAIPSACTESLNPSPLLLCLSLPSTDRIHGLATAIKARCVDVGLEAYLVFTRGSRPRLDAVRQGRSHIAVVSALAADVLGPPDLVTALVLTPNSFVREHRVYFMADRPQADRPRVAVDPSSLDFERLTRLEFEGQHVELVDMNYLTAIRAIQGGTIDAAILDVEDALMRFPQDIGSRPLSPRVLTVLWATPIPEPPSCAGPTIPPCARSSGIVSIRRSCWRSSRRSCPGPGRRSSDGQPLTRMPSSEPSMTSMDHVRSPVVGIDLLSIGAPADAPSTRKRGSRRRGSAGSKSMRAAGRSHWNPQRAT